MTRADEPKLSREERAPVFRRHLAALLDRHELTIAELCASTGIDRKVAQRWVKRGAERVSTENLARLARAFGIDPPTLLFHPNLLDGALQNSVNPVDRETNPAIAEVVSSKPALFERFTAAEWKELYSLRGTGGSLTPEGVEKAAAKIVLKRKIRRQFEALLETHHFQTLQNLIEVMYRDTEVPSRMTVGWRPSEPTAPPSPPPPH
jgi:transcriptional regulator with XRE-family HTH domain